MHEPGRSNNCKTRVGRWCQKALFKGSSKERNQGNRTAHRVAAVKETRTRYSRTLPSEQLASVSLIILGNPSFTENSLIRYGYPQNALPGCVTSDRRDDRSCRRRVEPPGTPGPSTMPCGPSDTGASSASRGRRRPGIASHHTEQPEPSCAGTNTRRSGVSPGRSARSAVPHPSDCYGRRPRAVADGARGPLGTCWPGWIPCPDVTVSRSMTPQS